MKTLYVIPARGGSKGIPKKNIKSLNGKPLIYYSIDAARSVAKDSDICVSSDCDEIISIVENYGLKVPFKRPIELSTDASGTYEVLLHCLDYYESKGIYYDSVMLLQPTSPFRKKEQLLEITRLYSEDLEMIVSVGISHQSPYFNLFEEGQSGYLRKSKIGDFKTRQEAPVIYFYNGSIYLINVHFLRNRPLHKFERIKKYVMDDIHSIDIDTPLDWAICETIISNGYIENENN
jgi:CMP-N,N'-diacetyllegionaminic acid synthase